MVLVVAMALRRSAHIHRTEQSIAFVVDPAGKEERILSRAALAVPEGDAPQSLSVGTVEPAIEDERISVGILQLAQETAGPRIERADVAVPEVAHQQVAAEA